MTMIQRWCGLALVLCVGCGDSEVIPSPTAVPPAVTQPGPVAAQCVTEMTFEVHDVNIARATVKATASKASDDVRLTDFDTNSQWIVAGPGTAFELDLENHHYSIEGRAGGCRWSTPHLFSIEPNPDNSEPPVEPPSSLPEPPAPPVVPPVVPPDPPSPPAPIPFADSFCSVGSFVGGVSQTRNFNIPAGTYTVTVTTFDPFHLSNPADVPQPYEQIDVWVGDNYLGRTLDVPEDGVSQVTVWPLVLNSSTSTVKFAGFAEPNSPDGLSDSTYTPCFAVEGVVAQ